jgi:hypothetical protein
VLKARYDVAARTDLNDDAKRRITSENARRFFNV